MGVCEELSKTKRCMELRIYLLNFALFDKR